MHLQAITGVLPRETPLHPNEPRPVIRRKVRTEFSLNDKLLTSPTTPEEKQLADLELQLEIQKKIVEASKKLMNERNIKQKVKKQRKANYDDAVAKLQRLDSDLVRIKKQLLEEHRTQLENKNRIKKQAIEKHLSPPAHSSLRSNARNGGNMHTDIMPMTMFQEPKQSVGSSRLARKRRGKLTSTSSENDCQSVPCSPIVTREFKIHPLSPVVGDDSPAHVPAQNYFPSRPTSILKKSRPTNGSDVYDEPDSCIAHAAPTPNELMRSNSVENVRRKSYISAVCTTETAPSFRGLKGYEQHMMMNKVLPKNPPPPVPNSMAKRPLPPTPSQIAASVSEPSVPDAVDGDTLAAVPARLIPDNHCNPVRDVDISLKAVRSSVIRTPAITVSTTSSSDALVVQNNQNNQRDSLCSRPSPSPSPSPVSTPKPFRSRAYSGPAAPEDNRHVIESLICPSPTPSSASTMLCRQLEQERLAMAEESKAMPPPSNLPVRKPKHALVKHVPAPLPLIAAPVSRSATPEVRSYTPSAENEVFEQEQVPPPSPFISMTRAYVETPRPDPIPMSPQVNSQTGVVVEVGTCRPSYEESKPFEFSDALKYSAKHRRRQETGAKKEIAASEHMCLKDVRLVSPLPVPNLMNESFIASAAVSDDFHNEMVDWYDENVKKGTVV